MPHLESLLTGQSFLTVTQLAVALARRFNGECINFDALQLYRGLPIATNQIRPSETRGIPHHLLACTDLHEPAWTVSHFVSAAEHAIRGIRSRGRLPILVGGTHYYVQALLFRGHSIGKEVDRHLSDEEMVAQWPILAQGNDAIFKELQRVDPETASRWHPKDSRKIRRSLEVWLETGRKPSEIYATQRKGFSRASVPQDGLMEADLPAASLSLLKHESLILWAHCDQPVLDSRLRKRVDCMVDDGLVEEVSKLKSLKRRAEEEGVAVDTSKGIWAAIGYKEFEHYLESLDGPGNGAEKERLRAEAIEEVKVATRQYAKRQTRWIRQKLFPDICNAKAESHLFLLDGTEDADGHKHMEDLACSITDDYLSARPLPGPKSVSSTAAAILSSTPMPAAGVPFQATTCQLCQRTVASRHDWEAHMRSRRHRGMLRRGRKCARQNTRPASESSQPRDT